ncbi:MAG TPA: hypothetical protein DDY78_20035 [Planctomycetales bacterium]|nr:hypothetical protein [Planctomycetales bacterium]
MSDAIRRLEVEVDLRPGEKLKLPQALVDSVGPGRWRIIAAPAEGAGAAVRRHDAFLAGYAVEDEGLYDGDASR